VAVLPSVKAAEVVAEVFPKIINLFCFFLQGSHYDISVLSLGNKHFNKL
jgi:hypothetical protein